MNNQKIVTAFIIVILRIMISTFTFAYGKSMAVLSIISQGYKY
jgi:hypothetical protein